MSLPRDFPRWLLWLVPAFFLADLFVALFLLPRAVGLWVEFVEGLREVLP